MKRSEMVCSACIKFQDGFCRNAPEPCFIPAPESHWCAQGTWRRWSRRYLEMEPYYWGEWEETVQ
ncbi:MAG: hypothetical protein ACP5M0_15765 [Desulfomonilaceae bacterium]